MRIIKEDNISNVIIFSSMLIIMTLILFSGTYFISKQYDILERGIQDSKEAFVASQKKLIKREVDSIINLINFKLIEQKNSSLSEQEIQEEILRWVNTIRFGKKNENYLFIYKLENPQGGDNFAKMILNPNRPDLEGEYISDAYKDANGKEFRKIFMEDIKQKGSSFVTYTYKKFGEVGARPKISYFRLYGKWNWIIAAGAYLDDIDVEIAQKKAILNKTVQLEITSAIIIFLLFSLVANAFAIFLGKNIEVFLKTYNDEVQRKTHELEEFNRTLENRVKEEVQKAREQEQLLIQKSKFIALGEMISNIAHQWRQPLSELSALMMTLKLRYNLGKLDKETIEQKSKEVEGILEYMSKTIDDFREFFMPKKEKKEFAIKSAINAIINIIGANTKLRHINIELHVEENEKIFGYKNEFEQAILNILTNAKQILFSNDVPDGFIKIELKKDTLYTYLSIEDNGGGIMVEPKEKIFEPYVTTKEESGGTGIGLYMSKIIIEKSMGGMLSVENTSLGAKFTIRLKRGLI